MKDLMIHILATIVLVKVGATAGMQFIAVSCVNICMITIHNVTCAANLSKSNLTLLYM